MRVHFRIKRNIQEEHENDYRIVTYITYAQQIWFTQSK